MNYLPAEEPSQAILGFETSIIQALQRFLGGKRMEMEYLCCPFCAWVRPKKYGGREVSFSKVDPSRVKVWQLRSLTSEGRGKGRIEIVDSKVLSELEPEQKEQIRNQCQRILAELEK